MFVAPARVPVEGDVEETVGSFEGVVETIGPRERPLRVPSSLKNLWFRDGVLSTRPGTTQIGTTFAEGTRVLGLVPFQGSAANGATIRTLIAAVGSRWVVWQEGSGWADLLTGLTSSMPLNGAMWKNKYCILTNGADPVKKYDGSTVANLGGNPPVCPNVITAFGRVWLFGAAAVPTVIYCSDVGNPEAWATGDAGSIDVVTRQRFLAGTAWREDLLFWTEEEFWILMGPAEGYTRASGRWAMKRIAEVGCVSGRTIARAGGALFWLSRDGIVAWTGGLPEIVSAPIHESMETTNWESAKTTACAGTMDEGMVYLLAVPTGQNAYPDRVIAYDLRTKAFLPEFSTSWKPVVFADFWRSGRTRPVFGDAAGRVWQVDY